MAILKILPILFLGAGAAFGISEDDGSVIKSELLELDTAFKNLVQLEAEEEKHDRENFFEIHKLKSKLEFYTEKKRLTHDERTGLIKYLNVSRARMDKLGSDPIVYDRLNRRMEREYVAKMEGKIEADDLLKAGYSETITDEITKRIEAAEEQPLKQSAALKEKIAILTKRLNKRSADNTALKNLLLPEAEISAVEFRYYPGRMVKFSLKNDDWLKVLFRTDEEAQSTPAEEVIVEGNMLTVRYGHVSFLYSRERASNADLEAAFRAIVDPKQVDAIYLEVLKELRKAERPASP